MNLKGLQEMLGVAEMFSGGCEEAAAEAAGGKVGVDSKENPENIETDSKAPDEETHDEAVDSDTAGQEGADEVTQETSEEEQGDVMRSGAVRSESTETSADYETVEEETDANSTSTLVYVLSTTFSILTAPLRPVVSTVTQLPGQVKWLDELCRHCFY